MHRSPITSPSLKNKNVHKLLKCLTSLWLYCTMFLLPFAENLTAQGVCPCCMQFLMTHLIHSTQAISYSSRETAFIKVTGASVSLC